MFVVVRVSAIDEHLHGYLTRFLSELDSGFYVGTVSAVVRKNLWTRVQTGMTTGYGIMIYSDPAKEQGFGMETTGRYAREVLDLDGFAVVASRPGRGAAKMKLSR